MGCSASRPDILLSKAVEGCSHPLFTGSSVPPSPSPSVPKTRSLTAPLVHHLPTWEGDTHHLVSLTSTTYGSLILVDRRPSSSSGADNRDCADHSHSPDSVINTWELMEGLDDDSGDGDPNFNSTKLNPRKTPNSIGKLSDSYVFVENPHETTEEEAISDSQRKPNFTSKPLWKHLSEESLLCKMDPNVASTYQRALSSRQLGSTRPRINTRSVNSSPIIPRVPRLSSVPSSPLVSAPVDIQIPSSPREDKIVIYFTSLRGIRKTYDDCCAVRMIFRGLRVPVDERDISMDSAYRKELKDALDGKALSLPRVFIKGKHVGGADEIKQMNEDGKLTSMLDGFQLLKDSGFVCDSCGDARFVPCGRCSGSRKVFQEDQRNTTQCVHCNENGLIRCPACCS